MAFTSHALSHGAALTRDSSGKPSLLSRFFAALMESRQRAAEREIARFIAANGGKLTDQIELEIEKHFFDNTGFRR
ncbi:MAG: hypothetical protein JO205_06910 [Pseudolabrys sp.]|nr:hypothetical protein [Pseudolabrys sp.]MBV9261086.1 hypothetical protein [Pseudolabrys sp.]